MKRLAVLSAVALALVLVAAGFTALGLWLGSRNEGGSFCRDLGPWHTKMSSFFTRVNREGSRSGAGLQVTNEVFQAGAGLALPEANSHEEAALQDTLVSLMRVHEEWLSEMSLWDEMGMGENLSNFTLDQNLEVYQRMEAKRVEGNSLLREANAQLQQVCNLPPLEIY